MKNKDRKINVASYKVLCTLLSLFEKNLTMKELVAALETYGRGPYNNFVASKYINTCKSCGLDIQKINGKYSIVNFPFMDKFSDAEVALLYELKTYSENLKPSQTEEKVSSFLDKLHVTFFKASNGLRSSENYRIIKMFEKARKKKFNIKVIFKNGEDFDCTPIEVFLNNENNTLYFRTSNKKGIKEISTKDIVNIRLTDKNDVEPKESFDVVFELIGKLAQRYQLRENEEIIKVKANGNIVVLNKYEDKKTLLRRLMRYDSSCKIKKPEFYVDEMKRMINESLNNYQ